MTTTLNPEQKNGLSYGLGNPMFKNKSSILSNLLFLIVVVITNYISLYLVLQTFDQTRVEEVLEEFKWLILINTPYIPSQTDMIVLSILTVLYNCLITDKIFGQSAKKMLANYSQ
jgi:hypothetical protein